MSYRATFLDTHRVTAKRMTDKQVRDTFGGEDGTPIDGSWLVLDDPFNQEAVMISGSRDDLRRLLNDLRNALDSEVADRKDPVVIRDGAALRNVPELHLLFLDDALTLDSAVQSPWGREVYAAAKASFAAHEGPLGWEPEERLFDDLESVVDQVDAALSDYYVVWQDGYTIEPYVEGATYDD